MTKQKKFQLLNVIIISVSHHIHDIYTSFLAPVQTLIIQNLGINYSLFGFLSVIQRIPTLFNPFIGILAEKIRLRYMIIVAPTITAVSMSLIGISSGYIFLALLMLISGISSALFHVTTPVMIRYVSGNKTGRGMSFYMVGGEFARTAGPVIVVGAVDLWGFKGIYNLIPMGVLASAILFFRFRKIDLRQHLDNKKEEGSYLMVLKKYLPLLISIALFTLSRGLMKSTLSYYLPGYLSDLGFTVEQGALSLSVIYLFGTAGTFLAGTISDYIGRKNTLLITAIVSPVLFWIYIFSKTPLSFSMFAVIGFFLLAPTPILLSIINGINSKHLPFLNGIYMTSNLLVGAISTMLVGFGFDNLGAELSFKISGIVAFLAIPVALLMPVKNKR